MSKKLKKNSDIKLTITMLVSNRRDTIRKCMESISPILQQVSSELIVVDTGSTDGSIDIVKEYTDKIIPFTWCNDFSAARNAGLTAFQGFFASLFTNASAGEYAVFYLQSFLIAFVGTKWSACDKAA